MEDWRFTTTISCMVQSDEPSLSQLPLLFQSEGQSFLSHIPLLPLLVFWTTIQSINQSMFCFISVHTEVTLDNNCNARYLQTCHHIVLGQPISLYGGTLKKWTKQTTLNKQTNKNTSKMNKTTLNKQTNKNTSNNKPTNKNQQQTTQDRQHMYCGTPLWKRFVKSPKRHKTGKTSVKCSIAMIQLTKDNRTHKLWTIQCTTIFFFFTCISSPLNAYLQVVRGQHSTQTCHHFHEKPCCSQDLVKQPPHWSRAAVY